jgi:hypothetical protein
MASTATVSQDDGQDMTTAVPTPRPPSEELETKEVERDTTVAHSDKSVAEKQDGSEKVSPPSESAPPVDENKRYLTGVKLFLVFVCV